MSCQANEGVADRGTNVVGRPASVLRHPEEHRLLPGTEPEPVWRHDDAQVPRADGPTRVVGGALADAEAAAHD